MIASAAFVLLFLVLGLAVVFIALGSGPRGARTQLHGQSRAGRRTAVVLTGLVTLAFGVGIPVAVIAANNKNQSHEATGGVELTKFQQKGRSIFAKNCSTCHTLRAANAVGRVGPDLDAIRPPKALVLDAIKNGRARGTGQMPAELVDGEDAKAVAEFVAVTAGR
jgi:mono/diheme cytochrome c family protein